MTCIVRIMFNYRKVNLDYVCAFHQSIKRLWINETRHWNVTFTLCLSETFSKPVFENIFDRGRVKVIVYLYY